MKKDIIIYTNPSCPYCIRAIELLRQKGQEMFLIDVIANPEKRKEMVERSGGCNTTPQIFIEDQHIGGCDDLYDLDAKGELDKILK